MAQRDHPDAPPPEPDGVVAHPCLKTPACVLDAMQAGRTPRVPHGRSRRVSINRSRRQRSAAGFLRPPRQQRFRRAAAIGRLGETPGTENLLRQARPRGQRHRLRCFGGSQRVRSTHRELGAKRGSAGRLDTLRRVSTATRVNETPLTIAAFATYGMAASRTPRPRRRRSAHVRGARHDDGDQRGASRFAGPHPARVRRSRIRFASSRATDSPHSRRGRILRCTRRRRSRRRRRSSGRFVCGGRRRRRSRRHSSTPRR